VRVAGWSALVATWAILEVQYRSRCLRARIG